MKPGLFQILFLAMVFLLLFGRGRLPEMLGDLGRGVKSLRRAFHGRDKTAILPVHADQPAERGVATAADGAAGHG